MYLYLAGPVRGHPQFNVNSFRHETARLRAKGYKVWSPVEYVEAHYGHKVFEHPTGIETETAVGTDGPKLFAVFLQFICSDECDAVALLPGHGESLGATAEAAVARALGKPAKGCWEF